MERVCNKTEFEVEGWRKIPPLMEILEQQYIPTGVLERMKLEMIQIPPIFKEEQIDEARIVRNSAKLGEKRSIRDSWIYEHFKNNSTNKTKIALYVNAVIPINQNLELYPIETVPNHCVIASGLTKWPKNNPNGIECLELENSGGSEDMRFIPVDFPFFEEVQIEVTKLREKHQSPENYKIAMNKLGKKLSEQKWGKIDHNWMDLKKETKEGQKIADYAKLQWKYQMLFVRGVLPCYQLKFTS